MNIYVENNGQTMGPFSISQLEDLLASKIITPESTAWLAGETTRTRVANILSQTTTSGNTERSTKLQRPPNLIPISSGSLPIRSRAGRRLRIVEVPLPSAVERLRMLGGATPFVVLLLLYTPFFRMNLFGSKSVNGFEAFEAVVSSSPILSVVGIVFIAAVIGIAVFSIRGSLHGAAAMPEAVGPCAVVAIITLAILLGALKPDSRFLTHAGGGNLMIGTILAGTAAGIMPGYNNSDEGVIASWLTCSILGLAALVFVALGLDR